MSSQKRQEKLWYREKWSFIQSDGKNFTSTGSTTFATGATRVKFGGDIASRLRAKPTFLTHGFLQLFGHSSRLGGRRKQKISQHTTPPTSSPMIVESLIYGTRA